MIKDYQTKDIRKTPNKVVKKEASWIYIFANQKSGRSITREFVKPTWEKLIEKLTKVSGRVEKET
jgi:hypothetical protein